MVCPNALIVSEDGSQTDIPDQPMPARIIPMSQVCISTVTEAELLFGVIRRPEAKNLSIAVHEFLLRVEILPWDAAAASSYATVRFALAQSGKSLGNLDTMIAAHAIAARAVLVTNDRAFGNIKHIALANWISS